MTIFQKKKKEKDKDKSNEKKIADFLQKKF